MVVTYEMLKESLHDYKAKDIKIKAGQIIFNISIFPSNLNKLQILPFFFLILFFY